MWLVHVSFFFMIQNILFTVNLLTNKAYLRSSLHFRYVTNRYPFFCFLLIF